MDSWDTFYQNTGRPHLSVDMSIMLEDGTTSVIDQIVLHDDLQGADILLWDGKTEITYGQAQAALVKMWEKE